MVDNNNQAGFGDAFSWQWPFRKIAEGGESAAQGAGTRAAGAENLISNLGALGAGARIVNGIAGFIAGVANMLGFEEFAQKILDRGAKFSTRLSKVDETAAAEERLLNDHPSATPELTAGGMTAAGISTGLTGGAAAGIGYFGLKALNKLNPLNLFRGRSNKPGNGSPNTPDSGKSSATISRHTDSADEARRVMQSGQVDGVASQADDVAKRGFFGRAMDALKGSRYGKMLGIGATTLGGGYLAYSALAPTSTQAAEAPAGDVTTSVPSVGGAQERQLPSLEGTATAAGVDVQEGTPVSIWNDTVGFFQNAADGITSLGSIEDGRLDVHWNEVAGAAENNVKAAGLGAVNGGAWLAGTVVDIGDWALDQAFDGRDTQDNYSANFSEWTDRYATGAMNDYLGGAPDMNGAWAQAASLGGGLAAGGTLAKGIKIGGWVGGVLRDAFKWEAGADAAARASTVTPRVSVPGIGGPQ